MILRQKNPVKLGRRIYLHLTENQFNRNKTWCSADDHNYMCHLCVKGILDLNFKGPYAEHILIPPGSTGSSVFFWFRMKAHIFLIANLKFRLQTPCSFGDMAGNVKLIGIPINNFLCIYIIASSTGLHTLFCLWRVNKKLPQGETSQNTFQRSRSIS